MSDDTSPPEQPPVRLPPVPPPTEQDWRDAREALEQHSHHRAGCPAREREGAACTCSAGRWINAIKV